VASDSQRYPEARSFASCDIAGHVCPIVQTCTEWRPTGAKTTTISVKGNNFFTDTQVLLGDTKYSEAAGNMAIKSDQSFELTSTLDQVASGTADPARAVATPERDRRKSCRQLTEKFAQLLPSP
jgi:hypothetical protein